MLPRLKKYKSAYLFILPFYILFVFFQLIPSLWTLYISFTEWKGIGEAKWIGLDNYKKILIDNLFWQSLRNTLVYWLSGMILIIVFSILIASLLNSKALKKHRSLFKTVTFLPNVCAAIAMGLIFRMLFDENAGLINELLGFLGMQKIGWLTNTRYSKIPVVLLNVWRNTPWFTMIVYSGLLNISTDYYEAATVDGAGKIKQFFYITLPSLQNILFFCSITLTVDSWKLFNESYILPGPGASNTSLFQYMYESGFNVFNMGYASAIGMVLMVILGLLSLAQFLFRRKQGEI